MSKERSLFGDGSAAGSGNVVSETSTHYGVRNIGGANGELPAYGSQHESVINFDDTGPLFDKQVIPVGAVVTEVVDDGITGTVATATVGAVSIAGAVGTPATYVTIATAGDLAVTGPTAGTVIVKWFKVA